MDANHIANVAEARERVERWPCTLPFDMSEAGDGTNIINILCFVSNAAAPPPPFSSTNAAKPLPPFPSRYDKSKEGLELLRHDLRKAAQRSGYHICVVRSYIKDGTKKKKITFGCHRKRLYTVQHAMTMKNKKEAGSKSLVLYSQNVKKTLLRVPKDGGTRTSRLWKKPKRLGS
jgi:hypothetical protein